MIPSLFLTELGVMKKVRIKDAWGNTAFLIKGKVPAWVKDVKVEDHSSGHHKYKDSTLAEMADDKVRGGSLHKVTSIIPMAAMEKDVAYVLLRLETDANNYVHVQRAFIDCLQQTYPKADLYLRLPLQDVSIVVGKVADEVVCIFTCVSMSNVRLINAEELIELYKEWSKDVKGINLNNYK